MQERRTLDDWKSLLTGNKYNMLTVLDVLLINNKIQCLCRCECGNTLYVSPSRVYNSKLKSCGCLNNSENLSKRQRERNLKIVEEIKDDYIGKVSGGLTVLDVKVNDFNEIVLVCKCICGNIKEIHKKSFGGLRSCGCRSSVSPRLDLELLKDEYIGKTYGKLTVLDVLRTSKDNIHHHINFKCQCECGNIFIARKKSVLRGGIISCGCYKHTQEFVALSHSKEVIAKQSKSLSEYCKNNPDKIKDRANKAKHTWSINRLKNSLHMQESFKEKRSNTVNQLDLSFIHPDDLEVLKSGAISSTYVRSKCPLCNQYHRHRAYHLISYDSYTTHPRLCNKCAKSFQSSAYEIAIVNYILEIYSGNIVRNDRTILNRKELDLYYPEKHIAIEFNGDYWHSTVYKPSDYHYNKFKECLEQDILLVSIFESHWNSFKDKIKEYLKDLFNGTNNKLSFDKDGYMNNNYPSFNCEIDLDNIISDCYSVNNTTVYTCGYSKLII